MKSRERLCANIKIMSKVSIRNLQIVLVQDLRSLTQNHLFLLLKLKIIQVEKIFSKIKLVSLIKTKKFRIQTIKIKK